MHSPLSAIVLSSYRPWIRNALTLVSPRYHLSTCSLLVRYSTLRTTPYIGSLSRTNVISHHHQIRSLFIQTESTPAEDSIKFKPGYPVLGKESRSTIEITNIRQAQQLGSPLALSLLRIEGIHSIMFGPDFITITKEPDTSWQLIKPDVFGIISDYYASCTQEENNIPSVVDAHNNMQVSQDTEIHPDDSEVVAMIKELLDTRIRPTIQDDGGDIEYVGFDEGTGTVQLKLKGACRTCDSSVVTLKNGIENMLQYFIPEVKQVEQVLDEVDRIANAEFNKLEQGINASHQSNNNNSNEGYIHVKN